MLRTLPLRLVVPLAQSPCSAGRSGHTAQDSVQNPCPVRRGGAPQLGVFATGLILWPGCCSVVDLKAYRAPDAAADIGPVEEPAGSGVVRHDGGVAARDLSRGRRFGERLRADRRGRQRHAPAVPRRSALPCPRRRGSRLRAAHRRAAGGRAQVRNSGRNQGRGEARTGAQPELRRHPDRARGRQRDRRTGPAGRAGGDPAQRRGLRPHDRGPGRQLRADAPAPARRQQRDHPAQRGAGRHEARGRRERRGGAGARPPRQASGRHDGAGPAHRGAVAARGRAAAAAGGGPRRPRRPRRPRPRSRPAPRRSRS